MVNCFMDGNFRKFNQLKTMNFTKLLLLKTNRFQTKVCHLNLNGLCGTENRTYTQQKSQNDFCYASSFTTNWTIWCCYRRSYVVIAARGGGRDKNKDFRFLQCISNSRVYFGHCNCMIDECRAKGSISSFTQNEPTNEQINE